MDANEAMLFSQTLHALKTFADFGDMQRAGRSLGHCANAKKRAAALPLFFDLPAYWMPGIEGIPANPF